MNLYVKLNEAPHLDITVEGTSKLDFHGAMVAIWTDHFDCPYETEYWYCIKDDLLDLSALKAKRRYEINKGNKNFTTKVINPTEYAKELYEVYTGSLAGYPGNPAPKSIESFYRSIQAWGRPECCLFGTFDNESGNLCGYSDVWLRYPYLPISSLKTIPKFERKGVNFALVYGIYQHFEDDIKNGAYLCDGARNSMHETQFQDFLIKYFGFRRAYCDLHLAYRWYLRPAIIVLFPVRNFFKKHIPQVYSLLKMEAWSRRIGDTAKENL